MGVSDDELADVMAALKQIEAFYDELPSGINRTVFHEAGHAVAACALGHPPTRASIRVNGESMGRVSTLVGMSAADRASYLMAGAVAEIKALQRAGAYVNLSTIVNKARGDIRELGELQRLDAPGAALDISGALVAAAAILDENWHRVENVARLLERDADIETIEIWDAYNA